jgi:hypothetical protein
MNNPKTIDQILEKLVKNFAYIWNKKERLWWGHDTDLENQDHEFDQAKLALLQAIEGVRPEAVPDGPIDDSDNAINSIPWETGYNEGISDSYKAIKELFNNKGEKYDKNN